MGEQAVPESVAPAGEVAPERAAGAEQIGLSAREAKAAVVGQRYFSDDQATAGAKTGLRAHGLRLKGIWRPTGSSARKSSAAKWPVPTR